MKKILITGASGFLGWHLCQVLGTTYELHGIYYRQHFQQKGLHWHRVNLLEEQKVQTLLQGLQPDLLIHAAAIANPNFCEEHPALSHHINVYSTVALAEQTARQHIPMLFTSTDLVFNGNAAPYDETDFPYPISIYGEQKLAAEESLLGDFEHTMVLRLPLLFGWGSDYHKNFFKTWFQQLRQRQEIIAFTDEYRTALSAKDAAQGIHLAVKYLWRHFKHQQPFERLLHLAAEEQLSRFDFAKKMATVFELDDSLILPKLQADLEMAAARPQNVALDATLATQLLQFYPPNISKALQNLKIDSPSSF